MKTQYLLFDSTKNDYRTFNQTNKIVYFDTYLDALKAANIYETIVTVKL